MTGAAAQAGTWPQPLAQGLPPAALADMLHELSQPLTVLYIVLEQAGVTSETAVLTEYVQAARGECDRAIGVFRRLQAAASALQTDQGTGRAGEHG